MDFVRSQRLKTMSMCVRLISMYRVYLVLYRAACWNVVLLNLFKKACQQRIFGLFSSRSAGSRGSSNRSILVQLMSSQPFCSKHHITNVSFLLSRVLFCAIFALFMFVLFVFISVLTTQ